MNHPEKQSFKKKLKNNYHYLLIVFIFCITTIFYLFFFILTNLRLTPPKLPTKYRTQKIDFSYLKYRKKNYLEHSLKNTIFTRQRYPDKYFLTEIPKDLFRKTKLFKKIPYYTRSTNKFSFHYLYPEFYKRINTIRPKTFYLAIREWKKIPYKKRIEIFLKEYEQLESNSKFLANLAIFSGFIFHKSEIKYLNQAIFSAQNHISTYYLSDAKYKIQFPEKYYPSPKEIEIYYKPKTNTMVSDQE